MPTILARLHELGLKLPEAAAPVGSYVPYTIAGNLVFIAGQLPREDGRIVALGHVGAEVDLATAQRAAQSCALNILAQVNAACGGDLERIEQCLKLGAFIASAPDFFDQPKVANGASDLLEKLLGARGQHARSAVGVSNLPLNAAVEIDAIFAIRGLRLEARGSSSSASNL